MSTSSLLMKAEITGYLPLTLKIQSSCLSFTYSESQITFRLSNKRSPSSKWTFEGMILLSSTIMKSENLPSSSPSSSMKKKEDPVSFFCFGNRRVLERESGLNYFLIRNFVSPLVISLPLRLRDIKRLTKIAI